MKSGSKILYSLGQDLSYRLALVRTGNFSDSWKAYVWNEETGETVYQSKQTGGISQVERSAQLACLRMGVSPILVPCSESVLA